jgi:hypothetical protein
MRTVPAPRTTMWWCDREHRPSWWRKVMADMCRWTGVSTRQAFLLRSQSSERCAVVVVRTAEVEPELARVGEVAIRYLDSALTIASAPVEHLNRWDLTIEWIGGEISFLRLNNTMVCARQCDNDRYSKQIYGVVNICEFNSRNISQSGWRTNWTGTT